MARTHRFHAKNNYEKEETEAKKLRRKYEQAKKEIKRLRNILKRVHPERLREALESKDAVREEQETVVTSKPSCERCGSTDLSTIEFNRMDGKHRLTFCKNIDCGHRTRPEKVTDTDSITQRDDNE